MFSEPDTSSGLQSLSQIARTALKDDAAFQSALKALGASLDYDGRFAAALRGRPVVLAYSFNNYAHAVRSGALPEPAVSDDTFDPANSPFLSFNGYSGNLPQFQAAAASGGHIDSLADKDRNSQREPMLIE